MKIEPNKGEGLTEASLEAAIDMIQKYKKYYLAGLELPVKLSKPKYFILRCVGDSCECEQRKREAIALMRSSQQ